MNRIVKIVLGVLLAAATVGLFVFSYFTGGITEIPADVMDQLRGVLPCAILPVTLVFAIGLPLVHAIYTMGWKPAVKFFVVGYIVAWIFEDLSVHTGIIFGYYHFPAMMGPKLDVIPFVIPMFWLTCFYMSYYVSNMLYYGTPLPEKYSVKSIITSAFLGGIILTTLDLSTDPFAAANGFWIWDSAGEYFGVPYHNFIGWFGTGFVTYVIHGFMLRHDKKKYGMELKTNTVKAWTIAPIVEYAVFCLIFVVMNVQGVLGMLTFFAMGTPALVAFFNWSKWYKKQKALSAGQVEAVQEAA